MYENLTLFTASDSPAARWSLAHVKIIVSYSTIWFLFTPLLLSTFWAIQICDPPEICQAHNQNPPKSTAVEILINEWVSSFTSFQTSQFWFCYIYIYAQNEGTFLCGVKVASLYWCPLHSAKSWNLIPIVQTFFIEWGEVQHKRWKLPRDKDTYW